MREAPQVPALHGGGRLALAAPAKVNLDLRIVGRRDDGYHLLESTLVLLELEDRLALIAGSPGLSVEPAAADVPVDGTNLAWRGLVAGMGGEPQLAWLTLEKRIPTAAGLGGGSSDAAAAWRLGRAWLGTDAAATPDELEQLAAIGADIPFFAAAVPAARVAGIGERIVPSVAEPLEIVLVHSPARLRTADVFRDLRREEWGSAENDLLAPARRLCADIDEAWALVVAAGGAPRLSGSGPTLFVATPDPERAGHVAGRLERAGRAVTRTRTRTAAASIERDIEEE